MNPRRFTTLGLYLLVAAAAAAAAAAEPPAWAGEGTADPPGRRQQGRWLGEGMRAQSSGEQTVAFYFFLFFSLKQHLHSHPQIRFNTKSLHRVCGI